MKKLNKFFAILVSLAMMATMCVVMAFADPDPAVNKTGEAYFTKTWKTNAGTKSPAQTFKFIIDQDTVNGVTNAEPLTAEDISFVAELNGTKMSNNLLLDKDWKNAEGKVVPGKYVYTVKEEIPTSITGYTKNDNVFTRVEPENATDETISTTTKTITYDKTEYTMTVYVNKDGVVEGVVVTSEDGKVTSNKPGTPGEDGLVNPNGFNFENTYSEKVNTKPQGSDPTKDPEANNDGSTLSVQKTITAANADQIDTDKEFNFTITVGFPEIDPSDSYTAKVIDKTGAVRATKTFTRADAESLTQTYKLRHGDRLVFENIDIGATYTTSETDEFGENDDYAYVSGNITTAKPVLATKNAEVITNNFKKSGTVPDSGIIISNLPYIVLALVAVGGLVAYVVVRRRQSDEA